MEGDPESNGQAKRNKPTCAERAKRVEFAAKLIAIKRFPKNKVRRILEAKYNVLEPASFQYWKDGRQLLRSKTKKSKTDHLSEAIALYESIVRDKDATRQERMQAQGHLDDILGLIPKGNNLASLFGNLNLTFVEQIVESPDQAHSLGVNGKQIKAIEDGAKGSSDLP